MAGATEVRRLGAEDIVLLREIDRTEQLDTEYRVVDGELVATDIDFFVPAWNPDGSGSHSVGALIKFAEPVLQRGAALFGAYRGDELLGLVVVDGEYAPGVAWLTLLYVTNGARRTGAASAMWAAAEGVARGAGAKTLYVSSAPTGSAVGFYFSRGCRLAAKHEIIPELFEIEPEDIHLVCELGAPS